MFKNCTNLGDGFDVIINNWNLSNSNFNDRIFENAFGYNKGSYNSGNISINNWNIREDTSYMFHRCNGFDGDLSGWTITDPTHMEAMFSQCIEFTGIGLSSWIVTSPTQIGYSMDSFCKDCNSLGLNQHIDISQSFWDYTYCTDLRYRFYRCGCLGINSNSSFKMDGCQFTNLTSSDGMRETFRESFGNSSYTNGNSYPNLSNNVSLRDWNIVGPSSIGVSLISMFYNCKKFDGDLSNWRITNPSTMASMLRTQNNEFTGSFLSSWTVTSLRTNSLFYE